MAIIVSKNHKDAEKLDKTEFGLERHLQEYLYDNPNVIPIYDIEDDIHLFVAAREFQTKSGPIDALGFDERGNIYVIETKLYRNPDKRTVVAQALDYGASLWRHHADFDAFIEQLDVHSNKHFNKDFKSAYEEFFGLDTADDNLLSIMDNLNSGNIKFVVLMDALHGALKDLIVYINQNSQFDIYAVELEYYRYQEFEIVIPKLFGAEVKKEIISRRTNKSYNYIDVVKQVFDDDLMARENLSDYRKDLFKTLRDMFEKLAIESGASSFYFKSERAGRVSFSIKTADGSQVLLIHSNGEIWFYRPPKKQFGEIVDHCEKILKALIENQLLGKTEANLSATRWSIMPKVSDDEMKAFVEICEIELNK